MIIGISLASFYPEHPEVAIDHASDLGFDTAELFINTFSELNDDYIDKFARKCSENNLKIYSLHPFTSALENYMFFSPYDRRIDDSVLLYDMYCRVAEKLGAKIINLHGDRGMGLKNIDKYIKCLEPIIALGEKRGVTFSYENVFFNSVDHPEFVYQLRRKLGEGALKFTFDIKQANKGGCDPYELCEAMGSDIVNFHINDYDDDHICMLPGEGMVDYNRILSILRKNNYSGPALIEVYSDNYETHEQIKKSAEYLNSLANL